MQISQQAQMLRPHLAHCTAACSQQRVKLQSGGCAWCPGDSSSTSWVRGGQQIYALRRVGASQLTEDTHTAACPGPRWAASQALHCKMASGGPAPTWMLAGPHSIKLASLRSRMRCKLLCTCVGSTSPCSARGHMQEGVCSHVSGRWVTAHCNEADATCHHTGQQQQRCSASHLQGMQHSTRCP